MSDRWQFDGDTDHLDELVVHNATIHLEAMDAAGHHWMLMIDRADGLRLHLHVGDVTVYETEGADLLATTVGGPLLLDCDASWESQGRRHICAVEKRPNHKRHRCDCGSTRRVDPTTRPRDGRPNEGVS